MMPISNLAQLASHRPGRNRKPNCSVLSRILKRTRQHTSADTRSKTVQYIRKQPRRQHSYCADYEVA